MENNEKNIYSKEYLEAWDAYFYPGTNTLKNKLDIMDREELKIKDAEISFERLVELYENPIRGNFDKEHLCAIHRYIFGDLYDWAGKYRTVYMQKNNSYFAGVDKIDLYLTEDLNAMREGQKYLDTPGQLAYFLADYYTELLNIHPFREGNGRTIREFLREFVDERSKTMACGPLELDYSRFDGEEVDKAIVYGRAFRGPIERQFFNSLVPKEKETDKKK